MLSTLETRSLGATFSGFTEVDRAGVIVKYIIGFDYKTKMVNTKTNQPECNSKCILLLISWVEACSLTNSFV